MNQRTKGQQIILIYRIINITNIFNISEEHY